jgi:hypothetical protein
VTGFAGAIFFAACAGSTFLSGLASSIRELRRFGEMLRPGREARFQAKMP